MVTQKQIPSALVAAYAESTKDITDEEKKSPVARQIIGRLRGALREAQSAGAELRAWRETMVKTKKLIEDRRAADEKAKSEKDRDEKAKAFREGVKALADLQRSVVADGGPKS